MTDAAPSPVVRRRALSPVPVWARVLVGVVVLAVAGLGAYLLIGGIATVPDVVGRSADDAVLALKAAGFALGAVTKVETSAPSGQVLAQDPAPGTLGRKGEPVRLTVAAPLPIGVPSVIGLSTDAARSSASAAGLALTTFESFDASATSGTVIAQAPDAAATVVKGAVVAVLVSKGRAAASVPVPNISGKREIDAAAVLTLAGFRPVLHDGSSAAVASGTVIGQLPATGTKAAPGSAVEVLVSRGKTAAAEVAVPNVAGKTQADAVAALTASGLVARVARAPSSAAATGAVAAQLPAANSRALKGAEVVIAVSTGAGAGGVRVPRLAGATSAATQASLESVGLTFKSVSSVSASVPAGQVIGQLPVPGALLPPGSPVLCIVSSGTPR